MTVQEQADNDSESAKIQILIIKNSIQSLNNVIKHCSTSELTMWVEKVRETRVSLIAETQELEQYKVKYPEHFL